MAQCVVCSTEIRDDARFCPSCGAEQPRSEVAGTDADPLMGKVVAKKFKVEKLLGVGGMGKVYKARQLSLDKAVVVKVLHDHFREDPQLVQRFQREAKAASRLNHPNSIQIIDFGQDEGGVVFMAMEFLQGQDLFSLLKKDGPLPPERVARVMIQVCSALAEAHEQNVIHRDLKPENIMVEDRRGQRDFVKVLDFGIAKIQDPQEGQQQLTQAGMVCGTPEYMSPEQARGLQLDPRSDIYALGVVMYQLAVGELPFVADTPIGIVTKHILEKPVPPRQRAPQLNIPEELEGIIMKAMEKEADKRYATVSDLGEALETLLSHVAGSQPTKTGARQTGPQPKPELAPPTTTRPTPSASKTRATGPVQPAPDAEVLREEHGGGGGLKIAAISFGAVVVVALAALVVVKVVLKPTHDVHDAGVVAVAHDAGPAFVDAGSTPTPPLTRLPDAGFAVEVHDAGTKPVRPIPEPHDAGPRAEKGGNRAEADKLYRSVHTGLVEADSASKVEVCSKAMPVLGKAAKLDHTFGEPLRDIALCQQANHDKDAACAAIKEYVLRKHINGDNADRLFSMFCN